MRFQVLFKVSAALLVASTWATPARAENPCNPCSDAANACNPCAAPAPEVDPARVRQPEGVTLPTSPELVARGKTL